jgi:hypothetical protein
MTSLLGCAGDDFSEVLKSLGYKLERKTVPIESPALATEDAAEPATEASGQTMPRRSHHRKLQRRILCHRWKHPNPLRLKKLPVKAPRSPSQ